MKSLISYLSEGNSTESNPSRIYWEDYWKTLLRLILWSVWLVIVLLAGYFGHYYWQQRFPSVTPVATEVQPDFELSDTKFIFKKQPLPVVEPESTYDADSADNSVASDAEIPASESIDENIDEEIPADVEAKGDVEDQDNSLHYRVQRALNEVQLEQKSR